MPYRKVSGEKGHYISLTSELKTIGKSKGDQVFVKGRRGYILILPEKMVNKPPFENIEEKVWNRTRSIIMEEVGEVNSEVLGAVINEALRMWVKKQKSFFEKDIIPKKNVLDKFKEKS